MTAVFHLLMTWLRVFLDGLVSGVLRDDVVKARVALPCSLASPAGTSSCANAPPEASDGHAEKSSLRSRRVRPKLQPRAPLTTAAASILSTPRPPPSAMAPRRAIGALVTPPPICVYSAPLSLWEGSLRHGCARAIHVA